VAELKVPWNTLLGQLTDSDFMAIWGMSNDLRTL
jgi:hypothetical protein